MSWTHDSTLSTGVAASQPVTERLRQVYTSVRERFPHVVRMAVALYDRKSDMLRTFLEFHSDNARSPLVHYRFPVSQSNSLSTLLRGGRPRLIEDLARIEGNERFHVERLLAEGYRSSFAVPLASAEGPLGVIFFNTRLADRLLAVQCRELEVFARLVGAEVAIEIGRIAVLRGSIQAIRSLFRYRDPETSGHLERMARYSRLIAESLAETHDIGDDWIEHLFLYTPMHDVGKLAIPDQILLKQGPLTPEEREVIRTHTVRGAALIDELLTGSGGLSFSYPDVLRNVVLYHHERIDGSGYPEGLRGEAIPLEARITAVADVFDALTSWRPYKPAWTIERTHDYLISERGRSLDSECVDCFLGLAREVEKIRAQFQD